MTRARSAIRTGRARPRRRGRGPWWNRWAALTGTPGVGKSSVAARLPLELGAVELSELARRLGAARSGARRATVIDLARTVRAARPRRDESIVVVGHLAQFLPTRTVVVLRCQPIELARRLARARRGTRAERFENVVCEAVGLVTWESTAPGRRVIEIDTSGRSVDEVARRVRRALRSRSARPGPPVEWLADRAVTDYLLRGVR